MPAHRVGFYFYTSKSKGVGTASYVKGLLLRPRNGRHAAHDRSLAACRFDLQCAADYTRAVAHDADTQPLLQFLVHFESTAVILDFELAAPALAVQPNPDPARLRMLDRVVHCLLCDSIDLHRLGA